MKAISTKFWSLSGLALLLIFLLPFERIPSHEVSLGSSTVTLRFSQLAALLLILGFAATRPRALFGAVSDRLWLPLTVFLAAAGIGAAFSASPAHSLFYVAYDGFVMLTSFIVAHTIGRPQLRDVTRVVILDLIIVGVVGLYQFVGDTAGLSVSFTGLKTRYTKSVFSFPRIQSTSLEPLYLANYLLFVLGTLWASRNRLTMPALALTVLLISLTLSRGAYLAVAVMAVIFFVWRVYPAKELVSRYAAVLTGIILALLFVWCSTSVQNDHISTNGVEKFTQQATNLTKGTSIDDRAASRRTAIDLFKDNPIFGVGVSNFGRAATKLKPAYFSESSIVNNEPAELLAETGIVGLVSILVFMLILLYRSLWAWRLADAELRGWLVGLTATVVGFGVQYQGFSTLYVMHIWVAIGLLVAVQQMVLGRRVSKMAPTAKVKKR